MPHLILWSAVLILILFFLKKKKVMQAARAVSMQLRNMGPNNPITQQVGLTSLQDINPF